MANDISLKDYYIKIARLNNKLNGENIFLNKKEINNRKYRVKELEHIIKGKDVWDDLVEKYKTPGNKINYTNTHNAILRHNHVHALRHIGNNYDIDSFRFVYVHNGEVLRDVKSGTGEIVYGLSTGYPYEGTLYIGNSYQRFLSEEELPTEDFIQFGKAVYKNREMMTIPSWELSIYGTNGIIPKSSVTVAMENTLTDNPKNKQYDMNNALLWCVSKGIVSLNGSIPIEVFIDFGTFPNKASVFGVENPNAKLNVDNELTKHVTKIIEHSNTLSEVVGHAFRKLFTIIMVISIKKDNPPLYNNILCVLLTRLKQVADNSNVRIIGMNVDCIEVDGEIDSKYLGNDVGLFKEVNIAQKVTNT